VERIVGGNETEGYDAPRLVGPGAHKETLDEIRRLEVLFDLLPLLPRRAIAWLLESRAYRFLPRGMAVRQLLCLALALVGDPAPRERIFTILGAAARGAAARWRSGRGSMKPDREVPAAEPDTPLVPVELRARINGHGQGVLLAANRSED